MNLETITLYNQAKHLLPLKTVVAGSSPSVIEAVNVMKEADIIEPILVSEDAEETTVQTAIDLLREDETRVLMKGGVHTDTLMRAVLNKEHDLRTDTRMSHCFHMQIPNHKPLIITDGALNVAPDETTLSHILRNSISFAHALSIEHPIACMLSATETPIASMPSSMLAKRITNDAQDIENATVVGPLALDGALSKDALRAKGIEGIEDTADILVVPNIETGNALFKLLVHMNDAIAAGVILGARIPIILNSRADPIESRVASVCAAALINTQ